MYTDAYPAWGFRTVAYTFSEGNRLLSNQNTVFQILPVNGDTMGTLSVYEQR